VSGSFLVIEGGDGSGKTTQARILAARLRDSGRTVVETFEPGATEVGVAIRALLLNGPEAIEPLVEALLLAADRAQEVVEVVQPALAEGADVVSDRYVPSSLAYQGVGRGLGADFIETINRAATRDLRPDVVVVLDVSDAVAEERARGPGDRLERAGGEFHATVRQAYRDLAGERGWAVIDGTRSIEGVSDQIWTLVAEQLGLA
jgi:dTMP kinase